MAICMPYKMSCALKEKNKSKTQSERKTSANLNTIISIYLSIYKVKCWRKISPQMEKWLMNCAFLYHIIHISGFFLKFLNHKVKTKNEKLDFDIKSVFAYVKNKMICKIQIHTKNEPKCTYIVSAGWVVLQIRMK